MRRVLAIREKRLIAALAPAPGLAADNADDLSVYFRPPVRFGMGDNDFTRGSGAWGGTYPSAGGPIWVSDGSFIHP